MIIEMKKRNGARGGIGKEKAIMLAASVFVLSALTLTGVYVKENNVKQNDDGFSIDLSSLENNNIVDEQAEADAEEPDASLLVQNPNAEYELDLEAVLEEGELDNAELAERKEKKNENTTETPQANKENPKKQATPETTSADETQNTKKENPDPSTEESASQNEQAAASGEESASVSTTATWRALEFKEESGLVWPTVGEILINYKIGRAHV